MVLSEMTPDDDGFPCTIPSDADYTIHLDNVVHRMQSVYSYFQSGHLRKECKTIKFSSNHKKQTNGQ